MRDWNDLFQAAAKHVNFDDNFNSEKILSLMFVLLGILSYDVAGLNHPDTAQEMVEIFKKMFAQYDSEINPKKLSPEEAAEFVNSYYQKAREISDTLMEQGKTFEDITKAHAKMVIDTLNIEEVEKDINFFDKSFQLFYKDTYNKYYGK